MCATLRAIHSAQGFVSRIDQYECVKLMPSANPMNEDARVKQKVTGVEYWMKTFAKTAG